MVRPVSKSPVAPRRWVRPLFALAFLSFGWFANGLRVAGEPWPRWMDGRFGAPMPWGMFASGFECSAEVVAVVSDGESSVELGRPMAYPGPQEWVWSVDDLWNQFAWFRADSVDWSAVEAYAREASNLKGPNLEVSFLLRVRRVDGDGVFSTRDVPFDGFYPFDDPVKFREWGALCS